MKYLTGRHVDTRHFGPLFAFEHLPERTQMIVRPCHDLAQDMVESLPDGPELTAGLRKLLEARDAFLRAALSATTR